MNNQKSEKGAKRTTYTDGMSLGSVKTEIGQSGAEGIHNVIGGIATALSRSMYEQTDSDPQYVAAKAELEATPLFRFRKRRLLRDKVHLLYSKAIKGAVMGTVDNLEIIAIEDSSDIETQLGS